MDSVAYHQLICAMLRRDEVNVSKGWKVWFGQSLGMWKCVADGIKIPSRSRCRTSRY